jgi:hypothetical protein
MLFSHGFAGVLAEAVATALVAYCISPLDQFSQEIDPDERYVFLLVACWPLKRRLYRARSILVYPMAPLGGEAGLRGPSSEIGWSLVVGSITRTGSFLREIGYRHSLRGINRVETVCQRPSPNFR